MALFRQRVVVFFLTHIVLLKLITTWPNLGLILVGVNDRTGSDIPVAINACYSLLQEMCIRREEM